MARTSSLNYLSCRNLFQTPHSLDRPPLFTKNAFFSLKSALSHPLPRNRLLKLYLSRKSYKLRRQSTTQALSLSIYIYIDVCIHLHRFVYSFSHICTHTHTPPMAFCRSTGIDANKIKTNCKIVLQAAVVATSSA